VKVLYRQTACDDVVRQFRYYLVTVNLPEVAVRFRDAVRHTDKMPVKCIRFLVTDGHTDIIKPDDPVQFPR
jgi:hypothetical protein